MPEQNPELIVISQYLVGGVPSFHRNMLTNMPKDLFDFKCIYLDESGTKFTKSLDKPLFKEDIIFSYGNESVLNISKRLEKHLSNREGVIVTNFSEELTTLDIYPKKNKTIYFICHDDFCIRHATKYENIIDVFIAHNIAVFDKLLELLPSRKNHMHFVQHGVNIIPDINKVHNANEKLEIVFLARHHILKGIYDLPLINSALVNKGVEVNWTILGDGPEREKFSSEVKHLGNFQFKIPKTAEEVYDILKTKDIYILPSRLDGLPVSMLEAMSVGCIPVVSNFSEGIKKVITPDIGYVVEQEDIAMYANYIKELHENRSKLKQLGLNCIDKVKDEFDIKKQALVYYDLYKNYKNLKNKRGIKAKDVLRKMTYNRVSIFLRRIYSSIKYKMGSFNKPHLKKS